MKNEVDIFTAGLGVVTGLGGILGYVKAKSVPSLVAGLSFGALLVGAGVAGSQIACIAMSTILGSMMTKKFISSKKFMPAGLLTVLCVSNLVRIALFAYFSSRHEAKVE
mmetsp:Transcript_2991/g.5277  ORF Transcript_2991/g.5277 Transcript_2991/m.5277 type:complete len:109 (-) Transcript_2991:60-386(-)